MIYKILNEEVRNELKCFLNNKYISHNKGKKMGEEVRNTIQHVS